MKIERIQQKVNEICEGSFCAADIGLLFVWLRPKLKGDPVLWDLANFVAHNDERDQGVSFDHVHKFVKNFLEVSENGGTVFGLQPIFQRDDVISKLINVLKRLGVIFEETKFIAQKDLLIDYLMQMMEETDFNIRDERITRCYLRRNSKIMMFSLQANLKGPVITMSAGASVESTLFN